ncbi:MAG TPA: aldehyde-activating protein [Gammaproteobacteria bacterium]|nr:aldehyde-activating protein [Gammaproteobacteria bacterium]
MNTSTADHKVVHYGGCHCGAVQFEFLAPPNITVIDCNCSVCSMSGFLHLIVDANDFSLLSGDKILTSYTFNTQTAQHLFCSSCGIKSFYIPRSHPNAYSVNARCVKRGSVTRMNIEAFDGVNWEESIVGLRS